MGAIAHEQDWRANVDWPTFARFNYLVIKELTIATLSAQVFVVRYQMSCCRFPFFPAGSLMAFWNPPAALLLHTNHPVQYQLNSIITRTVSWEQQGYYGFLLCTQGHFSSAKGWGITLIESTQIRLFSRWSGEGGWSDRAIAQQRSRISKLGLKGSSEYHSNEIAVEAARRRARGLI